MTLAPGQRLGSYEITAKLGEGGMGEVYRATDTKLKRDVAIKVLPAAFTEDKERLARFEREAQLLAQLHHPNIASIFGLEEADGTKALVMELVEGPTLAERLEHGPLPFNESLSISLQIAQALEEAHEKGIVHRDLKPQNIKASIAGKVKVLDFGLAKAMDPYATSAPSASQLAHSPTITLGATALGTILGTAAYMSPEQARGLPVDKRADIWAFGVVLYEMLSGRGAFQAATVPDTLAAVLTRDIDWSALPAATPPALHRLLRRCLERDPRLRLRDIGDARLELADLGSGVVPATAPAERHSGRSRLAFGAAAALAGATLGAGLAFWPGLRGERLPSTDDSPVRFEVPPPDGSLFNFSGRDAGPVAFSPDGRTLVFAATDPAGRKLLFVRRLDHLVAEPLAGTEGGSYPFWSPDSRHLGFFAEGKLKRIEATGGAVQVLCDAPLGRGGAWSAAGDILFSPRTESPLFRVSAAGGPVSPVTTLDLGTPVTSHRWPSFLPDGRRFLFVAFSTILSGPDSGHALYVGSLDRPEQHLLLRTNAKAEYVAPGFLLFTRERNLLAVRFDPRSLALRGEPAVIAEGVKVYPNTASALFSASQRGGVVFASGESPPISQLVWFDRSGAQLETAGDPVDCEDPRLSPDGRRIAANRIDPQSGASNIWIFGGAPASWSRFSFTPTFEHAAIWSPDGERIAFDSFRNPPADIYVKSTAGAGETLLVEGDDAAVPTDWSSDGRLLLFQRLQAKTGWDVWTASPGGEQPPAPVLATPSNEEGGQFSPDGRWLAYASDESGRAEIYVVAFPGLSGKWQISAAGGTQPRWRRDGRELFYLGADRALMAVAVEPGSAFAAATPTRLFHTRARYTGYRAYDVSLDGRRFLINTVLAEGESPPLTVALDSLPAANR